MHDGIGHMIPPGQTPPPLGADPPGQSPQSRHPPEQTPPRADTHLEQTPPLEQYHLRVTAQVRHHLGADTPLGRQPPGSRHHPPGSDPPPRSQESYNLTGETFLTCFFHYLHRLMSFNVLLS